MRYEDRRWCDSVPFASWSCEFIRGAEPKRGQRRHTEREDRPRMRPEAMRAFRAQVRDRTRDCCNSLGGRAERGERLIKHCDSWFSEKDVEASGVDASWCRATGCGWACHSAPPTPKLRRHDGEHAHTRSVCAKVHRQEGNSPELVVRDQRHVK